MSRIRRGAASSGMGRKGRGWEEEEEEDWGGIDGNKERGGKGGEGEGEKGRRYRLQGLG